MARRVSLLQGRSVQSLDIPQGGLISIFLPLCSRVKVPPTRRDLSAVVRTNYHTVYSCTLLTSTSILGLVVYEVSPRGKAGLVGGRGAGWLVATGSGSGRALYSPNPGEVCVLLEPPRADVTLD